MRAEEKIYVYRAVSREAIAAKKSLGSKLFIQEAMLAA